jgi:hypothetical protein
LPRGSRLLRTSSRWCWAKAFVSLRLGSSTAALISLVEGGGAVLGEGGESARGSDRDRSRRAAELPCAWRVHLPTAKPAAARSRTSAARWARACRVCRLLVPLLSFWAARACAAQPVCAGTHAARAGAAKLVAHCHADRTRASAGVEHGNGGSSRTLQHPPPRRRARAPALRARRASAGGCLCEDVHAVRRAVVLSRCKSCACGGHPVAFASAAE